MPQFCRAAVRLFALKEMGIGNVAWASSAAKQISGLHADVLEPHS